MGPTPPDRVPFTLRSPFSLRTSQRRGSTCQIVVHSASITDVDLPGDTRRTPVPRLGVWRGAVLGQPASRRA